MGEENETTEAPKWLKVLEDKRERRLKARLGHEAGAGAPCLSCEQNCPGLDLHFWRKICKNCKCSKEDHDVHDDDIYGWAQFELLGSKPNKIKRKILLPGKKDEVELEWSPKGQADTVEKFLKTLPPESLPVKGSRAAQDRKQMLQKQIPIHDIDPMLCHDLSEAEMKKMQEYVAQMKKNSVGVGQVIQIGAVDGIIVSDRFPKGISATELMKLQGQQSNVLSKKVSNMNLESSYGPGNKLIDPDVHYLNSQKTGMRDINYPIYENINLGGHKGLLSPPPPPLQDNQPKSAYEVSEFNRDAVKSDLYDLRYPLNAQNSGHLKSALPDNIASSHILPEELEREPVATSLRNMEYPNYSADIPESLPNNYIPINDLRLKENIQTPNSRTVKSENYPQYLLNENNLNANLARGELPLNKSNKPLPHFAPSKLNTFKDSQNPVKIGNVKDLAFSTYDPNRIDMNEINDRNKNSLEQQLEKQPPNQFYDDQSPMKTILKQKYGDFNQNKFGNSDHIYADLDFDHKVDDHPSKATQKKLPSYVPNSLNPIEDEVNPQYINVGSINDIMYDLPEIKSAINEQNHIQGFSPAKFLEAPNFETMPSCHRCKQLFQQKEFAVQVEQNKSLYHPDCLKCAGCNQILADMFYFYDKKSDDVYCGRDYAKIRGIPRCKACDELIFVKEYTLAENATFHIKHFCCFECDEPLAGKNYVAEDSQPICLPCYETLKADKCKGCGNIIKPDEQGANLNGVHFHATDACFACKKCGVPLLGSKMIFKNETLYCSPDCYRSDQ